MSIQRFFLRHALTEKLNEILFHDTVNFKEVDAVDGKSKKYGPYKAERHGPVIKLHVNKGIEFQSAFHCKRWPENIYEQEIFLRSLLGFVFEDPHDEELKLNLARKAVNELFTSCTAS